MVGDPGTRRPFPWHRPETWDRTTLGQYREFARLRRANHALRRGGLRWAHAEGDALVYLRESERQRLLVLAARTEHGRCAFPPAHSAWPARHQPCTATPILCDPIPTAP